MFSLEQVMERVYSVIAHGSKNCIIRVPPNLLGAKVKLVLIEQPLPMEELRQSIIDNSIKKIEEQQQQGEQEAQAIEQDEQSEKNELVKALIANEMRKEVRK